MIRLCRGCWTSGHYVGANSNNSVHENRMQENINVFDFTLTDKEMEAIEALDTGKSLLFSVPGNQLFCLTIRSLISVCHILDTRSAFPLPSFIFHLPQSRFHMYNWGRPHGLTDTLPAQLPGHIRICHSVEKTLSQSSGKFL